MEYRKGRKIGRARIEEVGRRKKDGSKLILLSSHTPDTIPEPNSDAALKIAREVKGWLAGNVGVFKVGGDNASSRALRESERFRE